MKTLIRPLALLLLTALAVQASARPNVIVIMTDDQGYGDFGVTGNPILDTPNLDAFAGQSLSFDRFYVSPVCTPTRASLMTGRYHHRTGALDTWRGGAMMRPGEITLAEALRAGGYATGIFGKWHLGDCYPMRAMDQGFDRSLVHLGGGLAQPADPIGNKRRYTDPILVRDGVEVQTRGYCTDVYFDEAIGFIRHSAVERRPFFAYIATNAPHGPYHDVPSELYEKYKAKDLKPIMVGQGGNEDIVARVFAMVENVDQNVGKLMQALDELELTDNTVVLFMLDNGPNTRRYVGNMRGMKTEVHDGGVRSPLFIRYPKQLKAGKRVSQTAAHIDVMPTLLDIAGVSKPDDAVFDGRSLLPLMVSDQPVDWPDRSIVIQAHRGRSPQQFHHFMLLEGRWKLVRPSGFGRQAAVGDLAFELYDLQADPTESKNLAADRPEVVQRLRQSYLAWYEDVNGADKALPRIEVASRQSPRTVLTRQDWLPYDRGWGTRGRWLLHAGYDQPVTATLLLREPIEKDCPVELRLGGRSYPATFRKGATELVIRDVQVKAGDFELEAEIDKGKNKVGPWHLVVQRQRPTLEVQLDTTAAPEAEAWARRAAQECRRWHPRIMDILGEDEFRPKNRVVIRFKKEMKAPAVASGINITVNADWIARQPNDRGLAIHELVHTIQRYGGGPMWVTEGLADYIRYYHYEPGSWRARFNINKAHYTRGYQPTAAFFAWIEREHDPLVIRKLHRAMVERSYRDELFEQATGKPLARLWDDFVAAEKARRNAR